MQQFIIKRRRGQKNIRIRITRQKEVIVSAPFETSDREIHRTLKLKSGWIQQHIQKLDEDYDRFDPLKNVLYNGRLYEVHPVKSALIRGKVSVADSAINVMYNGGTAQPEHEIRRTLEKWLISQAKNRITARTYELGAKYRIAVERVFFRNQRTRWGSSSSKGNLSFNWRIIMTPPAVQDYLIIHELMHQRHMNHSPKYWKEVEAKFPDYKKAEKWLKEHRNLIGLFR